MSSHFNLLLDIPEHVLVSILYCLLMTDNNNIFSMMQRVCRRFTSDLFVHLIKQVPAFTAFLSDSVGHPRGVDLCDARFVMTNGIRQFDQLMRVRFPANQIPTKTILKIAVGPDEQIVLLIQENNRFFYEYRTVDGSGQVVFLETRVEFEHNGKQIDEFAVSSIMFGGIISEVSIVKNYIIVGIMEMGVIVLGANLRSKVFVISVSYLNIIKYYLGVPGEKEWIFVNTIARKVVVLDMTGNSDQWHFMEDAPFYNSNGAQGRYLTAVEVSSTVDGRTLVVCVDQDVSVFVFGGNGRWKSVHSAQYFKVNMHVVRIEDRFRGAPTDWIIIHSFNLDCEIISTIDFTTGKLWSGGVTLIPNKLHLKSSFSCVRGLYIFNSRDNYRVFKPVVSIDHDRASVLTLVPFSTVSLQIQNSESYTPLRYFFVGTDIWAEIHVPVSRTIRGQHTLLASRRSRIISHGFFEDVSEDGAAGGAAAGGTGGAGS